MSEGKKKSKILRLLLILMLGISLVGLTGCAEENNETEENVIQEEVQEDEEISVDDIYLEVLEGTRNYIDENYGETDINEYLNDFVGYDVEISYSLLDMDEDSKNEMVILFNAYDGFYLILNYDEEDENVYGFNEVYRGLESLKTDGTYIASGGAYTNFISKDSYDKNVRTSETLAFENYADDSTLGNIKLDYEIGGETATEEEWNEFLDEFLAKEDAEFIEYDTVTVEASESSFEDGIYVYTVTEVGVENEGATTTITFENGDVTKEENYFDNYYSGTYIADGDTIRIIYTYHKGFDQGNDEYYSEVEEIEEEFTIDKDGNLIDESGNVYEKTSN